MTDPQADVFAAVDALRTARTLLVALDFDGTLAPFADDPAQVSALPGSWAAVLTLRRARATHVVLVSGRPLDGLATVSHAPSGMSLVGSHGAEWRVEGHDHEALTERERGRVARISAVLDEVGHRHGARIEHKPAGQALHTRGFDPERAEAANDDARAAVRAVDPDVLVRDGKDILEFAVRHVTKGDAIARLRDALDADRVFFAGDDVTDEDGFRVLDLEAGDVGVKVGDGASLAPFRVADPAALTPVLQQLARVRAMG
ncbi:trehalose-phosphatase [Curtobacterium ammoniigenes]|uniref:trehalose-phosphatase n=1 Tax=Curtobacterium ammoniigenes TaxID=395387 RepID=UPI0008318BB8|nr:trehalose-phosphatase [Curtobacterium ammoniigenes]